MIIANLSVFLSGGDQAVSGRGAGQQSVPQQQIRRITGGRSVFVGLGLRRGLLLRCYEIVFSN
jgi:hypothetical protein